MPLVVGSAGAVGGGSSWHTSVFCASRALWGSAASGKLAKCGSRAKFHFGTWHWVHVRGGGGSVEGQGRIGTMERKSPRMP